jgi:hypothetical protein
VLASFSLQLIVLYTPGLNSVFDVYAPEPRDWAFAVLFMATVFTALELGKYIESRKREARN